MSKQLEEAKQKARDEALRLAVLGLRGYVDAMGKWMTGGLTQQACLDLADELEARAKAHGAVG